MDIARKIDAVFTDMGGTKADSRELIDEIKSIPSIHLIGRGANRAVFNSDNAVYKVPISSTGSRQNNLAINHQHLNDHNPPLIARIIGIEGNILIQEYCPPASNKKDIVKEKLAKYGFIYTDWDDDSVGMKDGEPVLLDIAGLQSN